MSYTIALTEALLAEQNESRLSMAEAERSKILSRYPDAVLSERGWLYAEEDGTITGLFKLVERLEDGSVWVAFYGWIDSINMWSFDSKKSYLVTSDVFEALT